jgi:hypothetical protein
MGKLNQELRKLEALQGTAIPDRTVVLSRPTRQDGAGITDPIAQITERAIDGAPLGDHIFRLTLPDNPQDAKGTIEVDDTEAGEPRLKIVAYDIFGEDPDILGTMVSVGLEESGVARAIVESRFTNLSPDFLERAGGKAIEASNGSSEGGQVFAFSSTPPSTVNNHALVA